MANKGQSVYFSLASGEEGEAWVDLITNKGGNNPLEGIRFDPENEAITDQQRLAVIRVLEEAMFESSANQELGMFVYITPEALDDPLQRYVFPLILALRIAKEEITPNNKGKVYAAGYSNDWKRGRLQAYSSPVWQEQQQWLQQHTHHDDVVYLAADANPINDDPAIKARIIALSCISDKPIDESSIRSVSVFFPAVATEAQHSIMGSITLTLTNANANNQQHFLSCTQQAYQRKQEIGRILTAIRAGEQTWYKTLVDIQGNFSGGSYQLALVMADLMVRGKVFMPAGKLYATGTSSTWMKGEVEAVRSIPSKLELILSRVQTNDRVLLPKRLSSGAILSEDDSLKPLLQAIREKGANIACIDEVRL